MDETNEVETLLRRSLSKNDNEENIAKFINSFKTSSHFKSHRQVAERVCKYIESHNATKTVLEKIYSQIPQFVIALEKHFLEHPSHGTVTVTFQCPFYFVFDTIDTRDVVAFISGCLRVSANLLSKHFYKLRGPFFELLRTFLQYDCCRTPFISECVSDIFDTIGVSQVVMNTSFFKVFAEWLFLNRDGLLRNSVKRVLEATPLETVFISRDVVLRGIYPGLSPEMFHLMVSLLSAKQLSSNNEKFETWKRRPTDFFELFAKSLCIGNKEDVIWLLRSLGSDDGADDFLLTVITDVFREMKNNANFSTARIVENCFAVLVFLNENTQKYEKALAEGVVFLRDTIKETISSLVKNTKRRDGVEFFKSLQYIFVEMASDDKITFDDDNIFFTTIYEQLKTLLYMYIANPKGNKEEIDYLLSCLYIGHTTVSRKVSEFVMSCDKNDVIMKSFISHFPQFIPYNLEKSRKYFTNVYTSLLALNIQQDQFLVLGEVFCYLSQCFCNKEMRRDKVGGTNDLIEGKKEGECDCRVRCPLCDYEKRDRSVVMIIPTDFVVDGTLKTMEQMTSNCFQRDSLFFCHRNKLCLSFARLVAHIKMGAKEKVETFITLVTNLKNVEYTNECVKTLRIIFRFTAIVSVNLDNTNPLWYYTIIVQKLFDKEDVRDRLVIYRIILELIGEFGSVEIGIIIEHLLQDKMFFENSVVRARVLEVLKKCAAKEHAKTVEELFNLHRELDKTLFIMSRRPYRDIFEKYFIEERGGGFEKFIEMRKESVLPKLVYEDLSKTKEMEDSYSIDIREVTRIDCFTTYKNFINIRLQIYFKVFHDWVSKNAIDKLENVLREYSSLFSSLGQAAQAQIVELLKNDKSSIFEHFLLRTNSSLFPQTKIVLEKVYQSLLPELNSEIKNTPIGPLEYVSTKYSLLFVNRVRSVLGIAPVSENVFGWNDGFNAVKRFLELNGDVTRIRYMILKIIRQFTERVLNENGNNSRYVDILHMLRRMCIFKTCPEIAVEIALETLEIFNKNKQSEDVITIVCEILNDLQTCSKEIVGILPNFGVVGNTEFLFEENAVKFKTILSVLKESKSSKTKVYLLHKVYLFLEQNESNILASSYRVEELNKIINLLYHISRGKKEMEHEVGKIFGLIGAIPPGKIRIEPLDNFEKMINARKKDIVNELLGNYLLRELMERGGSETLLYVIMGLVKMAEKMEDIPNRKNLIVTNLTQEQNDIVQLINNSYMSINTTADVKIGFPPEQFLDNKSTMRYYEWVLSILSEIIRRLRSEKVRSDEADIFEYSLWIVKEPKFACQFKLIRYIFPLALLNMIVSCSLETKNLFLKEINRVLEIIGERGNETETNIDEVFAAQLIFESIDFMNLLDDKTLTKFISEIDKGYLVNSAIRVHSYERAYVLLDNHIKENEINGSGEPRASLSKIENGISKEEVGKMCLVSYRLGKFQEAEYWKRESLNWISVDQRPVDVRCDENNIDFPMECTESELTLRRVVRSGMNSVTPIKMKTIEEENWKSLEFQDIGKLLVQYDENAFKELSDTLSERLFEELASSYESAYETLKKLHILYDIQYFNCVNVNNSSNTINTLNSMKSNISNTQNTFARVKPTPKYDEDIKVNYLYLEKRLEMFGKSLKNAETILLVHGGLLLKELPVKTHFFTQTLALSLNEKDQRCKQTILNVCLKLSKLALHDKKFEKARQYCYTAGKMAREESCSPQKFWVWMTQCIIDHKQNPSFGTIKTLEFLYHKIVSSNVKDDELKSRIALKLAMLMEENHMCREDVIQWYKKAVGDRVEPFGILRSNQLMTKGFYRYGRYLDDTRKENEESFEVLRCYVFSLENGFKFHYEIVPRILVLAKECVGKRDSKLVNRFMYKIVDEFPRYIWYPFLPQIITQMQSSSFKESFIRKILVETLAKYPDQVCWHMVYWWMENNENASVVLKEAKDINANVKRIANEMKLFCSYLSEFSSDKTTHGKLEMLSAKNTHVYSRVKDLFTTNWKNLIVPIQKSMTIKVPNSYIESDFSPFEMNPPKIKSINNYYNVFASLQKPKKINILTYNENVSFNFILKSDDDIQKDKMVEELFGALNHLFETSPQTSMFGVSVRTYCVFPIANCTGLLEFVSNTIPIKKFIANRLPTSSDVKAMTDKRLTKEAKIREFKRYTLKHSGVLYDKFNECFKTPHAQTEARCNYIKTTAVNSMVGALIGIGDRHLENILLDTKEGGVVHIDFDAIFFKGLLMNVPEIVPFRFTLNIRDCLGATKDEGLFLDVCTAALSVFRHHKDVVMTFVEILWNYMKGKKSSRDAVVLGKSDIQLNPMENVNNFLEGRVDGMVLSERSQAQYLIKQAKSDENLGVMYEGWCPWV
ncbi:hypothetical protein EIN_164080 [Entamoeba invadens IP1]|uniref:Uncharacterized protein n=1 Tax=Entamoeba invadens IP1 TaxID=370355 RepID=A0A0A1U464_ENTIV|nr:hypothetical protein EIN_164080 [Entamoeba invadens IP1]ELP89028.1 hypothetical protein EIN_164080 [Entamoeba invadens IP1]|eukprot:XP_004255799.1 hypothetical protein EIN_164080 [Entamoeba invadens IP1]